MSTIEQSKYLSFVLRHGLDTLNLTPDQEGYVPLQLLNRNADPKYKLDNETVMNIVNSCPKQRFGLKKHCDEYFIRANQGHSKGVGKHIHPEKLLIKLKEPIEGVFHGTYIKHLESIKATGINRMNRQHIHIAKSLKATSGKRHDCDLIIYIDMKTAMEDGIEFFESANGVILTEGIHGVLPVKYLRFQTYS